MDTIRVGSISCRKLTTRGKRGTSYYWRIFHLNNNLWNGWATQEQVLLRAHEFGATGLYVPNNIIPDTVNELIVLYERWYSARKDISSNTKQTVHNALTHVTIHLGPTKVSVLNTDSATELDRYSQSRLGEGAAPNSISLEYKRLCSVWKWARSKRWVSNELTPLVLTTYDTNNHHTPNESDIKKVLHWLNTIGPRWAYLFVLIARETGARLSSVSHLKSTDIDSENDTITLHVKRTTKNRTRYDALHTVPVPHELIDAITGSSEYVLGATPSAVRGSIGRVLAKACRAMGVKVFSAHGLRRAAVQRFRNQGVPVVIAAEYLSHSPTVMFKHYEQVTAEDLRSAVRGNTAPTDSVSAPVLDSVSEAEPESLLEALLHEYRATEEHRKPAKELRPGIHPGAQPDGAHRVPARVQPPASRGLGREVTDSVSEVPKPEPVTEQSSPPDDTPWIDWSKV